MTIDISSMTAKIRTAIDDVKGTVDDDFSTDTDTELSQALHHGVEALLLELPPTLIEPTVIGATRSTPAWSRGTGTMGDGYIVLPTDFLRFLQIRVGGWKGTLYELMDAGSDEEKQQRSTWSRGTNTKPKAMLDTDTAGKRIVRYWPGSASAELQELAYVPMWSESGGKITCALRSETEKNIIYRAASIFLEGKKEDALADRFKQLSMM